MGNGQKYFNTDLKKLAIRNFREIRDWGAGNNQKVSAILLVKPEKLDNDQKYFDTDFKQLISRSVIGEEA